MAETRNDDYEVWVQEAIFAEMRKLVIVPKRA